MEDMLEDCLENFPQQVLAASSKAALAELHESLDSVSTYMTASIFLQNERAMLEDTGCHGCLLLLTFYIGEKIRNCT